MVAHLFRLAMIQAEGSLGILVYRRLEILLVLHCYGIVSVQGLQAIYSLGVLSSL